MIDSEKLKLILEAFNELPNGEMPLPFHARFLNSDGFSPPFETSIDAQGNLVVHCEGYVGNVEIIEIERK